MAHRGKGGRFVKGGSKSKSRRSVPRAVTVRENITIRNTVPRATVKRGKGGRRFSKGAGSLERERGTLIMMSAGVGWVDAARARFGMLPAGVGEQSLARTVGQLVQKIPGVGPFGWKAVAGGLAHWYHRSHRGHRWSDRIATVLLDAEGYAWGYRQGGGTIAGNGQAGGYIPAG